MLWVLHAGKNSSPIANLGRHAGRAFRARVRPLSYESLRRRRRLPGGAYLFVDLDLLDEGGLALARSVAEQVRGRSPLFNDPARALGRFELLERLFAEGINSYRADRGGSPRRWPVFVRGERDHRGPRTGLIDHPETLAAALRDEPGDLITVEFVPTRGADGLYRKYAACRVGERLFPRHLLFGDDWVVRLRDEPGAALLAEERAFIAAFPDRDRVRRIFEIAGLEYGRIDYGWSEHGLEVWEINTNPTIFNGPTRRMRNRWPLNAEVIGRHVEAMLELSETGRGRPAISLERTDAGRRSWFRR